MIGTMLKNGTTGAAVAALDELTQAYSVDEALEVEANMGEGCGEGGALDRRLALGFWDE